MKSIPWMKWCCAMVLGIALFEVGCKKDESNPVTPGGGGLATFNFTTPNQTFTVSGSGGATSAVLTGGTLPYAITTPPSSAVATASLSNDTLTVTPVSAGSTSITITDSNPVDNPRVVTINITVSGGGGTYGSGTVTATSSAGNLSFSGAGTWPPTTGPAVIAVYDTTLHALVFLAYQQVSGSHYNFVLSAISMPSGVSTGTYSVPTTAFIGVGYNADTTHADTTAYSGVSGTITVSSVSGSTVQGSYSGTAARGSGQPIQMSVSFALSFVRGRSPINIEGIGSNTSWGSGTLTALSSVGTLSFTGTGVWPPGAGPSVIAVYDTLAGEFVVLGYQQVSGSHYNFAVVAISVPSGIATGTYTVSQVTGFQAGYNADTSVSNNSYQSVSGSITVTAVSGAIVAGTYSGQASLGGGTPVAFSGTFGVSYVRGVSPIGIGARALTAGKLHKRHRLF